MVRRSSTSMADCCLGPSLCNNKLLHWPTTHFASPPPPSSSRSLWVSMASPRSHYSTPDPEPRPARPSLLVFSGLASSPGVQRSARCRGCCSIRAFMSFVVVAVAGGTAFNGVVEELKRLTTRVAHVLPVSDDGGSTAEIVRVLGNSAARMNFAVVSVW